MHASQHFLLTIMALSLQQPLPLFPCDALLFCSVCFFLVIALLWKCIKSLLSPTGAVCLLFDMRDIFHMLVHSQSGFKPAHQYHRFQSHNCLCERAQSNSWESAKVSHQRVFALLLQLELATKVLQTRVFALPGCQQISVGTPFCVILWGWLNSRQDAKQSTHLQAWGNSEILVWAQFAREICCSLTLHKSSLGCPTWKHGLTVRHRKK